VRSGPPQAAVFRGSIDVRREVFNQIRKRGAAARRRPRLFSGDDMKLRLHHRYSLVIVTLLLSAVMMIAGVAVVTFSSLSARTQAASARVMSETLRAQAISDGRDLVALAGQIVGTAL
jgi:hypothetical protein